MTSLRPLLLPLLVLFSALSSANELFPVPTELEPDVKFWRDVFTDYSTDEGVLHDNRNLGVVYERLPIKESTGRRERQRRVDKRRKALQQALRSLAKGKRDDLSKDETIALAAWPKDVSNESLRAAASRIRYQQGLRQRFRDGLERSGRWRDHVNKEFSALGVPIEIAALPHVESSYNPAARSHVGASGIWQFTRSTGRRFMRVDHVVDERNDPFVATTAAGQLMAYNYSLTGNWPMAITAYNHGLGGVRRAMRKYGDTAYVDILRKYDGRTFGFASRNFYVAFVAAMQVDQDVEAYFPGLKPDPAVQLDALELANYVTAADVANKIGVSTAVLRKHNPGLQSTVWQGSKYLPKGYSLRLPTGVGVQSLASAVAALPDSARFEQQLPDLFHTVARGDTVSQIAQTYKTRVSTLAALNNLNRRRTIRVGQKLRLPAAGPAPVIVAAAAPEPREAIAAAVADVADVADVAEVAEVAEVIEVEAEPEVQVSATEVAGTPILATPQTELLSDPSDYSVAEDGTIEVHPLETLGHFGDWLDIKTQRLRDLNGLAFRTPVAVGQRIKLDLNQVTAEAFEERRIAYHRAQQDSYFRRHVITGVTTHTIRAGESIWILTLRQYKVPVWLFTQYNPGVNMHRVRPGVEVQIPLLSDVEGP